MELTDKDVEILSAFSEKTLPEADRLLLENRLATDAEFNKAANEYWAVASALNLIEKRQKRTDLLKATNAEMPPITDIEIKNTATVSNAKAVPMWRWFAVAATFVLGTFALWQLVGTEKKLSPIVAEVFEPYPALGITKGDDEKTVRLEALKYYATKDYSRAIPLLEKAFAVEKDSFLLFYKGIALIGNGESAQAISCLTVLQTSEVVPAELVDWYLALAYVESGQKGKALILLKKVANTEGVNREKAVMLLGRLK